MSARTVTNKPKWSTKITKVISKIFGFFRLIVQGLWEIIAHCMSLITFFFAFLMKVLADPSVPCVVAIIFFMAVSTIAAFQWWSIGIWIGKAFGFGGTIGGYSSGAMGALLGLGLNVYQTAPELWKLRRDVAKAYADMGVDPDFDTSEETLKDKQKNWHSYDHGVLKAGRLVSYGIETALVVAYCGLVQHFQFIALVQAAVSLVLPEKALHMVSAAVCLLGEVSEKVTTPEEESDTSNPGTRAKQGFQQESQQQPQQQQAKSRGI